MIMGSFNFSKPRRISRAVVVVERSTALSTPSVPLATIDAPANKPASYSWNGPTCTTSPVPKKGMRIAKNTKGISIKARLKVVIRLIFATKTAERINKK